MGVTFPLIIMLTTNIVCFQRAKNSKSDARDIAHRTQEILDVVVDAVPDPTVISAPMLQSIERFTAYTFPSPACDSRITRTFHSLMQVPR
jgi:hypothetical protein